MSSTLAKHFMERKLREYEEPVRKGKAKGEAVGLSRRKYAAAMVMAIYAVNTQEVEEIIAVRRGLISKWRTEAKFLQQVEALREEYAGEVQRELESGKNADAFEDARHYSADMKKHVVDMCDEAAGKGDGQFLLVAWPLLRAALCGLLPR